MEMNLFRLLPEFILLAVAFFLLCMDFFLPAGGERRNFGLIGIIGSVVAGMSLLLLDSGPALAGLFVQDKVSIFFKWLFVLASVLILYCSMTYEHRIKSWRGEFYCLVLFSIIAMMLLASSADFVGFYVSLEFLAVCLYVLAAFTKDQSRSVEAGLKYLVTGALASGVLLYGVSFIYGSTGTTSFREIAQVLATREVDGFLTIGLVLVIVGLTFKVSSIPFHVWTPDVYQGAPTPVTALLAAGSKAAGFVVMMRILFTALGTVKGEWMVFVGFISAVTLLFGNLAAMPQKDIKRLVGYASIGSAGYLLMGIAAASRLGAGAIMFYLLVYLFAVAGSFLAIIVFSNAEGSDQIESYAGLSQRSPLLAATIFIGFLSLAGVPPLGGFIAKFYIFAAAIKEGFIVLSVIGVLMAIVSMYYFLLVIKRIYLRAPVNNTPIPLDPATRMVLYTVNAITIFLGVYPGPFTDWVMGIAGALF